MRVRHGYSNGFTRLMDGRIEAGGSGTRLTLRFRSIWWIELLVRVVGVAFVGPLLVYAIALGVYAQRGGSVDWIEAVVASVGTLVPLVMLIGIEWFARKLGDADEHRMRDALHTWFPQ